MNSHSVNLQMGFDASRLTLLSSASRLKFISAILSNVALRKKNEINENYISKLQDYFNWLDSKMDRHGLLDVFIMLTKLLIVKPELIHKICGHLLDLVIGEGLRWGEKTLESTSLLGAYMWCAVAFIFPTCWSDSSLGKGLSMSSSSLEECMLWVLTCGTCKTLSFVIFAFPRPFWFKNNICPNVYADVKTWEKCSRVRKNVDGLSPVLQCSSGWSLLGSLLQSSPSGPCSLLEVLKRRRSPPCPRQQISYH